MADCNYAREAMSENALDNGLSSACTPVSSRPKNGNTEKLPCAAATTSGLVILQRIGYAATAALS